MPKDGVQEPIRLGVGFDTEKFKAIIRRIDTAKSEADDARSDLGNLYKEAEESLGLNRPALKQALKIRGMEAVKREAFLRDLDQYLHVLGVGRQDDLFEGPAKPVAAPVAEKPVVGDAPKESAKTTAEKTSASDGDIIAAGRQAAEDGKPASDNPYGGD